MTMTDQRNAYLYSYQEEKLKRIPLDLQKKKYEEIKTADGYTIVRITLLN